MNKKVVFVFIPLLLCSFFLRAAERTYTDRTFYDKNKTGTQFDKNACWAASTANILMSWQDYLKKQGFKIPREIPHTLDAIYEKVYRLGDSSKKKVAEGNSISNGIAWFIAGIVFEEQEGSVSGGGFWKNLYNGIESVADLLKVYDVPTEISSLEKLDELFANSIKKNSRLALGLECVDLDEDGTAIPSHAITFWGYESRNGKAYSLYITDSDDRYTGKKKFNIKLGKDNKIYLLNYGNQKKDSYFIKSITEFEFLLPPTIKDRYVSASLGDDFNTGESWAKPFKSIERALRSIKVVAGTKSKECKIHIEEGTYTDSYHTKFRLITADGEEELDTQNCISSMNVEMLGGYSKKDKKLKRDKAFETIIKPNSPNTFALAYINDSSVIFDSIIFDAQNLSRGIYVSSSPSTELRYCTIKNARTKDFGAAICAKANLIISNSSIFNNTSEDCAGGIYLDGSIKMTNSTLAKNSAKSCAGLYITGAGLYSEIDFCTIAENEAKEVSGLYLQENANLKITNTVFWKNDIVYFGNIDYNSCLFDNLKEEPKKNSYNTEKNLSSRYNNCLEWNELGYYKPKLTLLKSKKRNQSFDQINNQRKVGCIGAVELILERKY